jgi:hypothetical protein
MQPNLFDPELHRNDAFGALNSMETMLVEALRAGIKRRIPHGIIPLKRLTLAHWKV